VAKQFDVDLVIREEKGAYYARDVAEHPLVEKHFEMLGESEMEYFGTARWPDAQIIDCPKSAVNEPEMIRLAVNARPDIVFLFGTTILRDEWLEPFSARIINMHLGLSPFYRGSATLFWPVANGELECVGATIHLAERKVDAGPILARVKPKLTVGDSYYDIGNKTIKRAIDMLPKVAQRYMDGTIRPIVQELAGGAVYRKRDFNPTVLRAALDFVGAGLTTSQIDHVANSTRCAC
jgi:folate-dependent phosphoribosylglycinamide formyltransferase PurN